MKEENEVEEAPATVRHYQPAERAIEEAIAAYDNAQIVINERESFSGKNSSFDEEVFGTGFKEAETLISSINENTEQTDEARIASVNAEMNRRARIHVFLEGEEKSLLNLNTKDEFFVGQTVYFGDELLRLYGVDDNLLGKEFEVVKVRYCYDIQTFPNLRGEDDFVGVEMYVKAI